MKNITSDLETILKNGLWSFKQGESYFSWSTCEGCFSILGGNRWEIEFKYNKEDKEIYEIEICQDCLDKIAN
jgi:hypothetical protein